MRNGLLVDTSALIAYATSASPLHENVAAYIAQAIHDGIPLHISSLAVAEFSCRQSIADLDLRTFILDSFDSRLPAERAARTMAPFIRMGVHAWHCLQA